jgi:hypothetical protein
MTNYLINPYSRIAGFKSLLAGLIGLLLLSFASFKSGTHFYGLSNIDFAKDSRFVFYIFEHLISWFVFAVLAFFFGLSLSKSHVRAIDFLGTSLIAKIPLIFTPILRFIPAFQSFVFQSFEMYFLIGVYVISLAWTIALLFNGYKVSSNLKNNRLIVSFIIGLVVSEIISRVIINLLIIKT